MTGSNLYSICASQIASSKHGNVALCVRPYAQTSAHLPKSQWNENMLGLRIKCAVHGPVPPSKCKGTNQKLKYHRTLSKAGIKVCANQKLNTNFGPVINNLGVNPLKKLVMPSFRTILPTILNPLSGLSKFLFWIRVLMTSRGAETTRDAVAPAIEATKFWSQPAVL